MSERQAKWLMLAVLLGVAMLAYRIHQMWRAPQPMPLTDRSKYLLSRSCTDAGGWPQVSDWGVSCHEFVRRLNRE
jgi:hypothetical protein